MRWLSKFIYFKILGWKVTGFTDFKSVKKAVIIAVPHTSWHDFYIGVLVRSVLGIKSNFVGKKSLFKFPHGYIFRALGGSPVERRSNENQVEAIARLFSEKDEFRIGMAPEGTRKKVEEWRTGFYYIAKTAHVPIIMFTLDFENKVNHFSEPFYPTDDKEADFKFMKNFFKGVKGKIPEYS
ncbi:MAG: 1-acyl-sn-glycerol-3-phosphate acyltransferase [Bacteroidia bacterium]|nr:1-acyl-sn-glycerol-3-phosphate acyltransferase [Bacteroidia bacterium]NND25566.1 acyltransferase [Flavobacteriaceae bacterium]MBT8278713.1 1-acyl-sn-glycerol-3-phosphate acyltransferase [Bacteroidia bacterium]NNK60536.1 acyltransferase [Flavobacteriaceae bacterium]NNL31988.1 acyltransferase [Flavobacteriaceae bacterium]